MRLGVELQLVLVPEFSFTYFAHKNVNFDTKVASEVNLQVDVMLEFSPAENTSEIKDLSLLEEKTRVTPPVDWSRAFFTIHLHGAGLILAGIPDLSTLPQPPQPPLLSKSERKER